MSIANSNSLGGGHAYGRSVSEREVQRELRGSSVWVLALLVGSGSRMGSSRSIATARARPECRRGAARGMNMRCGYMPGQGLEHLPPMAQVAAAAGGARRVEPRALRREGARPLGLAARWNGIGPCRRPGVWHVAGLCCCLVEARGGPAARGVGGRVSYWVSYLVRQQRVACGANEAHHFLQVGRGTHRGCEDHSASCVVCLVGNLGVVALVHLEQIRESETECKQQSHV